MTITILQLSNIISFMCRIMLIAFPTLLCSQENLILNGNCDSITACPNGVGSIQLCRHFQIFSSATHNSPDYFNACSTSLYVGVPNASFGYQYAHSGEGFVGIGGIVNHYGNQTTFKIYGATEYRESILGTLSKPLTIGHYQFKCYINCSGYNLNTEDKRFLLSAFDLMFLDSVFHPVASTLPFIDTAQLIDLNPGGQIIDDTLNWVPLSVCYEAKGGEQYFAIGTMRDSLKLNNLIFTVEPTFANEALYLSYYYFDSFSLIACDTCCGRKPEENVVITGNGMSASPIFQMTLQNGSEADLTLYDCLGKLILYHKFSYGEEPFVLPDTLARAMYQYVVKSTAGFSQTGKVLKL